MITDFQFMHRALFLANCGRGNVSPNPLVGAVVVRNDKIIGEGYHQQFGDAHAEVNAIENQDISGATLFVTLEPCNHHGKTPRCTDLIIRSGFKKVVVASLDPNPKMQGKSIEILRDAGIEVKTGLLENEALELNRFYYHFVKTDMPWITLKMAMTSDGFIARKNSLHTSISCVESQKEVHQMRSEYDAVMVGTNTLSKDNSKLTVRHADGRNPIRIVLDRNNKINNTFEVFADNGTKVYYFTTVMRNDLPERIKIINLSPSEFLLENIFRTIAKENMISVLVEGGASLANSILSEKIWDEFVIYRGQKRFENGVFFDCSTLNKDGYVHTEVSIGEDKKTVFRR